MIFLKPKLYLSVSVFLYIVYLNVELDAAFNLQYIFKPNDEYQSREHLSYNPPQ